MSVTITVGSRDLSVCFCILAMSSTLAFAQETDKKSDAKPASATAKRPSIYDKAADANVQLARAAERAKHGDKRILLMFGGDWCGWCHKLHGLFKTNRESHSFSLTSMSW